MIPVAKPVDSAPKGKPSIKLGALFDDRKQKQAEAKAEKRGSVGGATKPVKLKAPKDGVNKSGRKKLPPANALEAQGTVSVFRCFISILCCFSQFWEYMIALFKQASSQSASLVVYGSILTDGL